ncbi:MAG: TIGR03067 domain-containing protein [Fimbriimonadaceae bacterium]
MENQLPNRPNLEHLRAQAKSLLDDLKSGDQAATLTFQQHLPAASGLSREDVLKQGYRLADAQSAIARKTGFQSWPSLAHHVETLRSMEGTWEFVDLEVDGMAMPAAAMGNSRLLIDGDRFRMESPEATYEGIFTIDVDARPRQITINFVEGPEAGNQSLGIFELNGDHLKICLGLTGASRPSEFVTTGGSGHALENLKRVDPGRPADVLGGVASPVCEEAESGSFETEMTPTLERMQGEWAPLLIRMNGNDLDQSMMGMGSRTCVGAETKVIFGGQTMVHALARVHEGTNPIAVDYFGLAVRAKGKVSLGILEWFGEDLRICMASPGAARPEEFSAGPGSSRTLSEWRLKG